MGKEPYTKFCGVLIRFQEVVKLQSFKFSEMTLYHECTKHFIHGFLCIFLLDLWRKNLQRFMMFLSIFHELMNLRSFEWLNAS